eukprot:13961069-Ditylum_brightwellii.AAC.1
MARIFNRGLRSPKCMVTKNTRFLPSLVLQDPGSEYSKQHFELHAICHEHHAYIKPSSMSSAIPSAMPTSKTQLHAICHA